MDIYKCLSLIRSSPDPSLPHDPSPPPPPQMFQLIELTRSSLRIYRFELYNIIVLWITRFSIIAHPYPSPPLLSLAPHLMHLYKTVYLIALLSLCALIKHRSITRTTTTITIKSTEECP